jgi:hypothetical protein
VRTLLLVMCASVAVGEELPILWAVPGQFPPTLRDIAGRLPRDTQAREPDLITYAHEGSHFLCRGRPGYHAIYIGNGDRWEIPTPPLVTEEVFAAIPAGSRTNSFSKSLYQTYLQQGRSDYWHRQPLMILDEWRAYTVGSHVRQELGVQSRGETVAHAETLARYAKQLHTMASEIPEYDMAELTKFCRWNLRECYRVKGFATDVRFD